jgi:protein required for attachment to host cells
MSKLRIPHDAFILVGDGRKALFLRNDGDEKFPNLKVEQVELGENPPSREQGSDKQTQVFQSADGRRAAADQTDWHNLEEQRFARDVAARMEGVMRERGCKSLIIVAPARTLAELRTAFHEDVRKKIVAEVEKDLTKHPVHEIERHLTAM